MKWLIAVDDRRKALEYAEREEMREGWYYCDVEFVGYVDELLSNRERRAHVERMLRLEGLDPQELASILERQGKRAKR